MDIDETVDVDVHLSVDEVYNAMNSDEKREMKILLTAKDSSKPSFLLGEEMFLEKLNKISMNYYSLTPSEQETIENISKRF